MEKTHVSAHMFFVKSLIFNHDPCCYLVFYLVLPALREKYSLFIDSGSADKFFDAWFILVDYADVSCICKSFDSRRSAANLQQAAFLQKVDGLFQLLHISW